MLEKPPQKPATGDVLEIDESWVVRFPGSDHMMPRIYQNAAIEEYWSPAQQRMTQIIDIQPPQEQDQKLSDMFGHAARFIVASADQVHFPARGALNRSYGYSIPAEDRLILQPLNPDGSYDPAAPRFVAYFNAQSEDYYGTLYQAKIVDHYQTTFIPSAAKNSL